MVDKKVARNFNFLWKYNEEKQEVLSKILGKSQSTISDYANGKRPIPVDVLTKISDRYGVSADDLINKDLSLEYDAPQAIDVKRAMNIGNNMFPLFSSNIAKNNDSFNRAYEITINALAEEKLNLIYSKICILEHAIELYKKAWEESQTYVALSNSITLVLFIYAFYNQRNMEIAQMLISKGKLDTYEIKQLSLRDPNKPKPVNKYEIKRKAFLEKYYDLVFEHIKLLKSNLKFSNLGDFYLSLCYLQGFVDIDFDYDSCFQTALMMMYQQAELENTYAIKFLESLENIENIDN